MTTHTQTVSAGMVTTAMSNKRKVSFFSPDPVSYAKAAVATIGIQEYTHGCWSHALQVYITGTAGLRSNQCLSRIFFGGWGGGGEGGEEGGTDNQITHGHLCVLFYNFTNDIVVL